MEQRKQTAVEWLVKELNNLHPDLVLSLRIWDDIDNLINQAKQIEKEQIKDAYSEGFETGYLLANGEDSKFEGREQYYNATYGKE